MANRVNAYTAIISLVLSMVAWSGCEEELRQTVADNTYTGAAAGSAGDPYYGVGGTAGGVDTSYQPVAGSGGSTQPPPGDEGSDDIAPVVDDDDGPGDLDQPVDDAVDLDPPPNSVGLKPLVRNPRYASLAPPLGEPLPSAPAGQWTWVQIDGAMSRDGSPAGFYYKFSTTGSKNLLVYLVGGGACQDVFFCSNNPPNKDSSLTAEGYMEGAFNLMGPTPAPQDPTLPMWQTGIFKDDPANPCRDWNMVFIPYVTGDVYAGDNPNGAVPGYTPPNGQLNFVGRKNMELFVSRIMATFQDTPLALLAGSSAGGLGALMSASLFADSLIDHGTAPGGASGFIVDDAGPIFDDEYTPVCLQRRYRELFGLDRTFPADCEGCFNADGGGMVAGYLAHLVDKYPNNLLGGLIDSDNDEIMQLFYSDGYNDCDPNAYPPITFPLTMTDLAWAARYREGLLDLVNNHMQRMSSYLWPGTKHQNLFMAGTVDRFYEKNGLEMTVAEWLTKLLQGEELHLGLQ